MSVSNLLSLSQRHELVAVACHSVVQSVFTRQPLGRLSAISIRALATRHESRSAFIALALACG